MVKKLVTIVLLVLAASMLMLPATAALVPMSWGFPQLWQDRELTAFEKSFAEATESQSAAVAFPTAGATTAGLGTGSVFGASFPTITQTGAQNNLLVNTRFMQERESFAFAYPYLSIGGSPVPSMGFI